MLDHLYRLRFPGLAIGALVLQAVFSASIAASSHDLWVQRVATTRAHSVGAAQIGEGELRGRVIDARSGEPVTGALVRIVEPARSMVTRVDGSFRFERLPDGEVVITVQRIGYAPVERRLKLAETGIATVEFELVPSAIEMAGLTVTGAGGARERAEGFQPTSVLEGAELRRHLGASIAAMLSSEPGVGQRYNGPIAAQPVIRGLSGDRVLVLEDGSRTGDIATTAPDHAITIEPLTAERIEVVRGPAGLLYGSSALGGVINVVREEVPRERPERVTGAFNTQLESVNAGMTAGGALRGALGPVAVRGELTGRRAADTRTPLGTLPATDLSGYNGGVGASITGERGYAGVAVRDYDLRYGVPGTFNGVTIPGAHEGGVYVETRRSTARFEGALYSGVGPFQSVEGNGSFVRFRQDELEHSEDGEFVGARFGQRTASGGVTARHRGEAGGVGLEGAVGVWGLWRSFQAAGLRSGTRSADQGMLAGFAFQEASLGRFRLQGGLRYDWSRLDPVDTTSSRLITGIRRREYGAVSASLGGLWDVADGVALGMSVARSFRTPAIEELYSDGPHLASYSYDIGNPDLGAEYGIGTDLFLRLTRSRLNGEVGVFHNRVDGYIHYAPTGEIDPRFRRYPIYRAAQSDAALRGAEGKVQWEPIAGIMVGGQLSYVRGELRGEGAPLPAIPPLHGVVRLRLDRPAYFAGVEWTRAAAQRRTAEFELPTAGYALLGMSAGVRWIGWNRLQTVTLVVDNLMDTEWRDHLSRIRAVAPQPGRNISLLYRVDL